MESNWRYGVAFWGLSGDKTRLASRELGVPFADIIICATDSTSDYLEALVPRFGDPTIIFNTVAIPSDHPHYPYGRAVGPDV